VPLHRVLGRVKAASRRPVAIFDLDSTLISTQRRNHVIVSEFATREDVSPVLRHAAGRLRVDDMGWNPMEDLRRLGVSDEQELRRLRGFWIHRFFSDDYLRHDDALPGATQFVTDVHTAGGFVVYLTGRPEGLMGRGTRLSLAALGFPMGERTQLYLKPTPEEMDHEFKRRVCEEIARLGEVVAAFENEPGNANIFAEAFPEAEIVLLETMCSPGAPECHVRVARVRHFLP
jgi:hypothetical protein